VAWEPLGWKAAFLSEIEPFPRAVLAHHYPDVPLHGDFTKLRNDAEAVADIDLLVGGTPCQAFSVAGLRQSLADDRGNLTLEFVRLADAIDDVRGKRGQPGITILWENVPGVLSTKDNAFGCFLAGLVGADAPLVPPSGQRWTDAGLVVGPRRAAAWRILDAQYLGLAQRRERVFVVANPRNGADPSAVLFEPEGVRRHHPPSRSAGPAVAALTASGVGTCGADDNQGQAGHLIAQAFGGGNTGGGIDVSTALTAHSGRYDFDTETVICQPLPFDTTQITSSSNRSSPKYGAPCHPLAAGAHAPAIVFGWQNSASQGDSVSEHVSPTLDKSKTPAVAYAIQERATAELNCGPGGKGFAEEIAYTLEARNRTQYVATIGVRRLIPTECEALQGFPRDYTLVPHRGKLAADGPRYKALGNSMAVPVMRWIGERIAMVEGWQ
jgi:DNA (cytosine-5)-methyltransferase 1